jgi:hypothetical protein
MFWCRGVHHSRHVTYRRKTQSAEYSFDELTDMIHITARRSRAQQYSCCTSVRRKVSATTVSKSQDIHFSGTSSARNRLYRPIMTNAGKPRSRRSADAEDDDLCVIERSPGTSRGIFVTERRSGSSFSEGHKPERRSGTFFSLANLPLFFLTN